MKLFNTLFSIVKKRVLLLLTTFLLAIGFLVFIAPTLIRTYGDPYFADIRKLGPKPRLEQDYAKLEQNGWLIDSFKVDDNVVLHGIIKPPKHLSPNSPWLLFFHGNGGLDYSSSIELYNTLFDSEEWGFAMWGYRGYGLSEGVSTKTLMREDSVVMAKRLIEHFHASPHEIRIMGFSLGTAPATHAGMALSVEGLAPAGVYLMATGFRARFPNSLIYDPKSETSRRDKIVAPILITHGKDDHSHKLESALEDYLELTNAEAEFIIARGGHFHLDAPGVLQRVKSFLKNPKSE